VDGVAVRSPIRTIWPCRGRKCEPVRCHGGRALFCESQKRWPSPFQKQESNHRPKLLFFHFPKIREHVRFHTQSKQNKEERRSSLIVLDLSIRSL